MKVIVSIPTKVDVFVHLKAFLIQLDATQRTPVEICNSGSQYTYDCRIYPALRRKVNFRITYAGRDYMHSLIYPHPLFADTPLYHVCVPIKIYIRGTFVLDVSSPSPTKSGRWNSHYFNHKIAYNFSGSVNYVYNNEWQRTPFENEVSGILDAESDKVGRPVRITFNLADLPTVSVYAIDVHAIFDDKTAIQYRPYGSPVPLLGAEFGRHEACHGMEVRNGKLTFYKASDMLTKIYGIVDACLENFSNPDALPPYPEEESGVYPFTLPDPQEIEFIADRRAVWLYHTIGKNRFNEDVPTLCGFRSLRVLFYLGHPLLWKPVVSVQDDFGRWWVWQYSLTYLNKNVNYYETTVLRRFYLHGMLQESKTCREVVIYEALPSPAVHASTPKVPPDQRVVNENRF